MLSLFAFHFVWEHENKMESKRKVAHFGTADAKGAHWRFASPSFPLGHSHIFTLSEYYEIISRYLRYLNMYAINFSFSLSKYFEIITHSKSLPGQTATS